MRQTSKPKLNLKNALRWILLIICGCILGVNVYLANANSLLGNQLPMPFGYGAAVVLSGSMEPEFSKGDLIIVAKAETCGLGDIVVYQDGNSLVVHRVIDMDSETITTKGDANDAADEPVNITAVKGIVLFWIPFVGRIVERLKTPVGTLCVIAAAIALLEIPRRNERKKDAEERQKIIEEIERLKEKKEL